MKNRKKLMAAQHLRFTKESKVIKELIDDGVFGEIYHAIAFALRRRHLPDEEIKTFLECVKEDKEVPVRPEESLEVIKMLDGIYKSAETGKEVIF